MMATNVRISPSAVVESRNNELQTVPNGNVFDFRCLWREY
jgi:hypothetical protein